MRAPALTREQVETELLAIVAEAGVAGVSPTATLVGPAVERVLSGEVTIDQVRTITVEYVRRRRRGDKDLPWWRDLFYGRNWSSTRQDYLGQAYAPKRSASALPGNQAEWERKRLQLVLVTSGADDGDAGDSSPDWSHLPDDAALEEAGG